MKQAHPHADAEVLLQDAWMRRAARALLKGTDGADDLAQESWVVALEKRRGQKSDQPWLAGVLRYRAWASKRSSAAREHHEGRARREHRAPAADAAADEAAEQLELRRRVTEELAALDEPYRSAIYLHVIEGQSLRQAAAQLSAAPSTVQARVNDGLTQLRKRLDEAYGGERSAWAALVIPWTVQAKGLSSLAIAAGVLAVFAVGAGSARWLTAGSPGQPSQPSASPASVDAHASSTAAPDALSIAPVKVAAVDPNAATRVPAAAAPSSTPVAAPTAINQTTLRITGRFVSPSGAPLTAGGTWTLERHRASSDLLALHGSPPSSAKIEGSLGPGGELEIALEPHPAQRYWLTVDAAPWATAAWRWNTLSPTAPVDLGTVHLRAAGEISGRVVNKDGGALPPRGWRVTAREAAQGSSVGQWPWTGSVTTELDGSFLLRRVPAADIELQATERELGRSKPENVLVTAGQTAQVEIPQLIPPSALTSISVELDRLVGPFVPEASLEQVVLISESGDRRIAEPHPHEARFFRFTDVGPGTYRCEVNLPGVRPWWRDGLSAGESVRGVLWGASEIRLNVADPDGESLADCQVIVTRTDTVPPVVRKFSAGTRSPNGGRIFGLVPGDYALRVEAGTLSGEALAMGLGQDEARSLTIAVAENIGITGRVIYTDGAPGAGIVVRLAKRAEVSDSIESKVLTENTHTNRPELFRTQIARALTNEAGDFSFAAVQEPDLVVLAGERPGPLAHWRAVDVHPDSTSTSEPILLALNRSASLSGRIRTEAGVDTSLWRVRARTSDGQVAFANVNSDGSFALDDVKAGPARLKLEFRSPSRRQIASTSNALLDPYHLGTADLRPGEATEFTCDYPGAPLTQVAFTVEGAAQLPPGALRVTATRVPTGPSATAASIGSATSPLWLEPGQHRIWASYDGGLTVFDQVTIPPAAPSTAPQTIMLSPELSTARVRVLIDGESYSSGKLHLSHVPRSLGNGAFTTDEEGFANLRLGRGRYELYPDLKSVNDTQAFYLSTLEWPPSAGTVDVTLEDPFR